MTRYILATLCTIALAGSVYMAGWGSVAPAGEGSHAVAKGSDECEYCTPASSSVVLLADVASTSPATQKSAVDMKNTKCIVMGDDIGTSTHTVEYKGKLYHTCCPDCVETFNKDPEKYVKAFDADPSKFGVKK